MFGLTLIKRIQSRHLWLTILFSNYSSLLLLFTIFIQQLIKHLPVSVAYNNLSIGNCSSETFHSYEYEIKYIKFLWVLPGCHSTGTAAIKQFCYEKDAAANEDFQERHLQHFFQFHLQNLLLLSWVDCIGFDRHDKLSTETQAETLLHSTIINLPFCCWVAALPSGLHRD